MTPRTVLLTPLSLMSRCSSTLSFRQSPSWIEATVRYAGIALILALLTATPGSKAAAVRDWQGGQGPSSSAEPQSYQGVVTDTHCGAKHSVEIGRTATDCTILCVRRGEQFSLVDGNAAYVLEGDLQALKLVAGQRVKILGKLNGNKISITAITSN